MEKLIPSLMLICTALGVGTLIRERLKRELGDLNDLISDLKLMLPHIQWDRKALKELLVHQSVCGKLKAFWNEMLELITKSDGIENAAGLMENRLALPLKCRSELSAYFASFGRGNASVESEKLKALIEALRQTEVEFRAEREKRIKLVLPLSAMAGSAAALLML